MLRTSMLIVIAVSVSMAVCSLSVAAEGPSAEFPVVPWPMKLVPLRGTFPLTRDTMIFVDSAGQTTAQYLAGELQPLLGVAVPVRVADSLPAEKSIVLRIDPALKSLGPEGYALTIAPDRVEMRAAESAGLFYACQTLRQLVPAAAADGPRSVPCVRIEDKPRFAWRGLMLDPARCFLDVKLLKRYIDVLAEYKMNRLHLHLTDDDAWTLEIKRYPELTDSRRWPMKPAVHNGGFYRQDDIRELVAYAATRHVMLVPEIESPAHNAVLATALREKILCRNNPYRSGTKPFDPKASYEWTEPCAASPAAFEVYKNILDETMGLFPSPYVHLGGDEYFGRTWEACPDCRTLVDKENLRRFDTPELKRLFAKCQGSPDKYLVYRFWMTKLCDYVRSQGRQPILWDDLAWRGDFPAGVAIMQWHYRGGPDGAQHVATPEDPAIEAASAGRPVIAVPFGCLYFDYDRPMELVYRFEAVPASLPADRRQLILGPQAAAWAMAPNVLERRVFPRLYALAEVGWSSAESRNWRDFVRRLEQRDRTTVPGVKTNHGDK
jgi:hexosaminidase